METVFLVVRKDSETSGHGMSSNFIKLAKYNDTLTPGYFCPIFKERKKAEEFIEAKAEKYFKPEIIEVPIM